MTPTTPSVIPRSPSILPTRNGNAVDILNPRVEDIDVGDVALSLARKVRYNGWLAGDINDLYSIAQHSVYVGLTMEAKAREFDWDEANIKRAGLLGLTHDVPEYVLSDVVTPLKVLLPDYQKIEHLWEPVCFDWAGCPNVTAEEAEFIKWADRTVLLQEMVQFGRSVQWARDGGWEEPIVPLFEKFYGPVWKPQQSHDTFIQELARYRS
jgi:5'-deoxynucleotidase YfbR-like HD superfamily hydrolase